MFYLQPITHPGTITVDTKAEILKAITGKIPGSLNIIRTIAGLALPIRCTLWQGFSMGSCTYSDICKDFFQDIYNMNQSNCPPEFAEWGIYCTCPFKIPAQSFEGSPQFQIQDLSTTTLSFLAPGDFDVTINLSIPSPINNLNGRCTDEHTTSVPVVYNKSCYRFKFTMQKA